MKLFKLFIGGGLIKMTIVSVFGLLMFFFLIRKILIMIRKNKYDPQTLTYILVFGSLSFFSAILIHLTSLSKVMELIQETGNMTMTRLAGGYKVMLISPIYGLTVFIFSLLAWGILKEINTSRFQKG